MKLWPDSIAGRTIGLLFAGLVFTTASSLSIYLLDIFHGKGWDETFRNLQRIAVIATIMDPAPPEARIAWLPHLSGPGLSVVWDSAGIPPPMRQDAMTRHLARDIRVFSGIDGPDRIKAGYPDRGASATGWLLPEPGPAEVWIALSDKTWLGFAVAGEEIGGLWILRIVLAATLLVSGIAVLGVWAARWVTAPLARFAFAAQKLGANVDAPAMSEDGPSEIRQAARAFNEMQSRIRRLIDDRTLMLAAISHDLRTALTRLRFRIEFIADRAQRRKADADLDEMLSMLQSTLTFARDDAQTELASRLDLAMLLQSLCDDLQDGGKEVSYRGPLHLGYEGRPLALRRALANLIDNALTYGEEGIVELDEKEDTVEIKIGDRGPGIPKPMREQVFAPFFRMESSRSRETGGMGLGLTVARAAVRRHGGDIELDDRPGGGLLVRIVLPKSHIRAPEDL